MNVVFRPGTKIVSLALAALTTTADVAQAQGSPFGDDIDISYLYAAVMGREKEKAGGGRAGQRQTRVYELMSIPLAHPLSRLWPRSRLTT